MDYGELVPVFLFKHTELLFTRASWYAIVFPVSRLCVEWWIDQFATLDGNITFCSEQGGSRTLVVLTCTAWGRSIRACLEPAEHQRASGGGLPRHGGVDSQQKGTRSNPHVSSQSTLLCVNRHRDHTNIDVCMKKDGPPKVYLNTIYSASENVTVFMKRLAAQWKELHPWTSSTCLSLSL